MAKKNAENQLELPTKKVGLPQAFEGSGENMDESVAPGTYDFDASEDTASNKLRTAEERKEAQSKIKRTKSSEFVDDDDDDDYVKDEYASDDDDDDENFYDEEEEKVGKKSKDKSDEDEVFNDESEFDDDTIERLEDLGLSAEDFAGTPEKMVRKMVRAMEKQNREVELKFQAHGGNRPDKKSDDDKGAGEDALDDLDLDLDPDDTDPKLFASMNKLKDHTKKILKDVINPLKGQITELKSKLEEREQADQQNAKIAEVNQFDSLVNELVKDEVNGEFFSKTLGEGTYDKIDKKSPQFKNRGKIFEKMLIQRNASSQAGHNISMKQAFDEALILMYSSNLKEKIKHDIVKKITNKRQTITMRPASRKSILTDEKPGRKKAENFVKNFIEKKKAGMKTRRK